MMINQTLVINGCVRKIVHKMKKLMWKHWKFHTSNMLHKRLGGLTISCIYNAYSLAFYVVCIGLSMTNFSAFGQQDSKNNTTKTVVPVLKTDTTMAQVNFSPNDSTIFQEDTIRDQHNDVSPLDIGSDRGIFILSSNRLLQLRILGSVRANFNFSDQDLVDPQTFNPYYIPTDALTKSPNFFAGLEQTRLAFEVTRRTKTMGDVFIRIEGDFKNSSKSYRIRHAYGQMGNLLLGQTWSLMNNVSYQPAIVSLDGPAGGSGLRTTQFRYSRSFKNKKMMWNAAVEYSLPSFSIPDSLSGKLLQVIPDFTGRYSYFSNKISFRVAAVISTISGRIESDDISYSFGVGASFSGWMKLNEKSRLYLTMTSGRAISHFIDMFSGNNQDMTYNPNTNRFEALVSTSGFLGYDHNLPNDFSASFSFGASAITNHAFQPADAYSHSYNALLNLFWEPINGARLGIEYANGQRFDYGGSSGVSNRVSMLMYYDF